MQHVDAINTGGLIGEYTSGRNRLSVRSLRYDFDLPPSSRENGTHSVPSDCADLRARWIMVCEYEKRFRQRVIRVGCEGVGYLPSWSGRALDEERHTSPCLTYEDTRSLGCLVGWLTCESGYRLRAATHPPMAVSARPTSNLGEAIRPTLPRIILAFEGAFHLDSNFRLLAWPFSVSCTKG